SICGSVVLVITTFSVLLSVTIIFEVSVPVTVIGAARPVAFTLALAITVPVPVTSVVVSVTSLIPTRRVITTSAARRGRTSAARRSPVSTTVTARVKAPGCRWRSASPLSVGLEMKANYMSELSNSPQSSVGHHDQCVCCAFHGRHHLHHDGFHTLRKRT
ncbi:hypothetical protein TMatcc_005869, partial [Talaromyces marneffei ATCC 18224]